MEETAFSLQPFFLWMAQLSLSQWVLSSTWAQPIVQVMHLVALSIFAGSILIVDLRLLGLGVVKTPLAKVAQEAWPWMIWAFVALFLTGMPSLMSLALKQYFSPFFWWKMELLLLGLIFTVTLRWKVTQADESRLGPVWPKAAGMFSISIWTGVATNARLIGLFS
jgi:hypothetical protein